MQTPRVSELLITEFFCLCNFKICRVEHRDLPTLVVVYLGRENWIKEMEQMHLQ